MFSIMIGSKTIIQHCYASIMMYFPNLELYFKTPPSVIKSLYLQSCIQMTPYVHRQNNIKLYCIAEEPISIIINPSSGVQSGFLDWYESRPYEVVAFSQSHTDHNG
jgi:hypothetical protein